MRMPWCIHPLNTFSFSLQMRLLQAMSDQLATLYTRFLLESEQASSQPLSLGNRGGSLFTRLPDWPETGA